eukprot:1112508-Pelagomonas_calceolata.AAC.2
MQLTPTGLAEQLQPAGAADERERQNKCRGWSATPGTGLADAACRACKGWEGWGAAPGTGIANAACCGQPHTENKGNAGMASAGSHADACSLSLSSEEASTTRSALNH